MTKQEFLEKLAALLQDIPAEEREAALEFYRGYFDDAGEGREAEVIRELESREKVAEQIKNVDAVCEIVDARIPASSRNPANNPVFSLRFDFI